MHVRRSSWLSNVQTVKSKASKAPVVMPEALATLLKNYLATWQANPEGFLFLNRKRRPYFAELHPTEEALADSGRAIDSAMRAPRLPALSREFAARRGREPEGRAGTDAAFGSPNHSCGLRPCDRERAARCSGQSGRDTTAGREIQRPNAPKLRIIGE